MISYELGVVVPVYNSALSVASLCAELEELFIKCGLNGRIILVNDGSTDDSAEVIDKLARSGKHTTAAHLRHNAGQQSALLCGLTLSENCRYIATIDDDLQHPAALLEALYHKICNGYDLVYAVSKGEHKPLYRRVGSLLRDALFALFTQKPKGIRVSSYRIMSAALAAAICSETQQFVYLSASAFRHAPQTANIPYNIRERAYGHSGYTFGKLVRTYTNIFIYYTWFGACLRPKTQIAPYELSYITEGGALK